MLLREARKTGHIQYCTTEVEWRNNFGSAARSRLKLLQVRLKRRILDLLGATQWLRGGYQEIVMGAFMARVRYVPKFVVADRVFFLVLDGTYR